MTFSIIFWCSIILNKKPVNFPDSFNTIKIFNAREKTACLQRMIIESKWSICEHHLNLIEMNFWRCFKILGKRCQSHVFRDKRMDKLLWRISSHPKRHCNLFSSSPSKRCIKPFQVRAKYQWTLYWRVCLYFWSQHDIWGVELSTRQKRRK